MTGARSSRRARSSVESKMWALEAALLLGGDAAQAREELLSTIERGRAKGRLDDEDVAAYGRRRARLEHALAAGGEDARAYARDHGLCGVVVHETARGARIARLVLETFPGHVNYAYLVDLGDARFLLDVGSGLGRSREDLQRGFAVLRAQGFPVAPTDVDVVMISHGHIDHFGDAAHWKSACDAPVWVHELDARVLENFRERTILTGRDMRVWLQGSGVGDDEVARLIEMYLAGKDAFAPVVVDRRLRHGEVLFDGRVRVIHTPGHCPGHVCLRVDDALLVADQVLSPITPHITPQALNPHNGLERYLFGLARLMLEQDVSLVLPAHYDPIPDLRARIVECAEDHVDKIRRTIDVCAKPATVSDVAAALFGEQEGYGVLLALLEAGTHVEYLHQLGALVVADLDSVERDPTAPLRYRSTEVGARSADDGLSGRALLGGG